MKKVYYISLLVLSIALFACKDSSSNTATSEIELISPQQVYDAVNSNSTLQLVDVRTKKEFIQSHIKGAQNICITDGDFKNKIKTLDKNKPIYVYCQVGARSAFAAKKLRKMGFKKIYDMDGGMILWNKNKLDTE